MSCKIRPGAFRLMAIAVIAASGMRPVCHSQATDVESVSAATPDSQDCAQGRWRLMQAHIYFRHGDRSPNVRSAYANSIPANVKTLWAHRLQDIDFERQMYVEGGNPFPFGLLTKKGAQQARELGQRLRQRYAELIEGDHADGGASLQVRSTNYARTHASARFVLDGLLNSEEAARQKHITFMADDEESLYPNPACKSWGQLSKRRLREAASREDSPEAYKWHARLEHITAPSLKHFHIPPRKFPWLILMDALICAEAHGDPWPDAVKAADFRKVKEMNAAEVSQIFSDQDTCQIAMGNLIGELLHHLTKKADSQGRADPPRLLLYSGHDTTLLPLCACLGVPLKAWPEYASDLAIELWLEQDTGQFFVRVLYNGQSLFLPKEPPEDGGSWPGTAPTEGACLCRWHDFKRIAQWSYIPPEEVKRRCNETLADKGACVIGSNSGGGSFDAKL